MFFGLFVCCFLFCFCFFCTNFFFFPSTRDATSRVGQEEGGGGGGGRERERERNV